MNKKIKTQKWHLNFSSQAVLELLINILHTVIFNSRTAGPTKILIPFFFFFYFLGQIASGFLHYFPTSVDNFEICANIRNSG